MKKKEAGLATTNPAAAQAMREAQKERAGEGAGQAGTQPDSGTRDAGGAALTGIGTEQIKEALSVLNEYKNGKKTLEQRIIDNEKWYRLKHWENLTDNTGSKVQPSSGWLFNALANKHADSMDNFPVCTVQPREAGDQEEAQRLSSIIPVVMDQCEFEEVYDAEQDYKLKNGTGVFGIFWDSRKLNGLGDIAISQVDLLNLFWEPGVKDIQQGRNLFYVELVDNEALKEQYPELGESLGGKDITLSEYVYDDNVDTQNKSTVIDWYYKRLVNGRTVLHYCKFCGDNILFASENDPAYRERGWYDHGMYPFVMDPLFRIAGSPCGFGYIDVGKNAQEYIDRGNQAMMQNMLANARPRHFIRSDGSVNEEEYADTTKEFVHVDGGLGQDSIRPIEGKALPGNYITLISNKIDELKEVMGNRDISTGGTMSGVTAASAIAAMQEAGSKLSRDSNKAAHRAFRKVCLMVIELIRQFYDLPRQFRITGENGQQEFISYDNSGIQPQDQGQSMGVDMGLRVPLFDVAISSEKASPYSRLSQNEMAMNFYSAGFFKPELADQALACMELMDFDGKAKTMNLIRQNQRQFQAAQQMAMLGMGSVLPSADPQKGEMPEGMDGSGESSVTRQARQRVADATSPG